MGLLILDKQINARHDTSHKLSKKEQSETGEHELLFLNLRMDNSLTYSWLTFVTERFGGDWSSSNQMSKRNIRVLRTSWLCSRSWFGWQGHQICNEERGVAYPNRSEMLGSSALLERSNPSEFHRHMDTCLVIIYIHSCLHAEVQT